MRLLVLLTRPLTLLAAIILMGVLMTSCGKGLKDWKTPDVPILQREKVQSEVMPKLACGIVEDISWIKDLQSEGVTYPDDLAKTDFNTHIWVYANLPVKRLAYSSDMEMLFIVPESRTSDGMLHFLRLKKLTLHGIKMASPD